MGYEPERKHTNLPKSIQRFLMTVGKDVSVTIVNGKTINGILDSFCMKPALQYIIVETTESIEIINFSNVITLRQFKDRTLEI